MNYGCHLRQIVNQTLLCGNRISRENDRGLEIPKIFSNSSSAIREDDSASTRTCVGGYTPAPRDGRSLRVTVIFSSGASVTLSPDQRIGSVPFALVTQTLQGLSPSNFIQSSTTGTQAAFDALTGGTGSEVSSLHHHDSRYLKSGSSTPQSFGSGGFSTSGAFTSSNTLSIVSPISATTSSNSSSPAINILGNYWNGITSASDSDSWSIQSILGTGANPDSTLKFSHSGSSGSTYYSFMNGNVGIGTTKPTEKLVVGDDLGELTSGTGLVVGNSGGGANVYVGKDASNYARFSYQTNKVGIQNFSGGTLYNSIYLDAGNVGIGTT